MKTDDTTCPSLTPAYYKVEDITVFYVISFSCNSDTWCWWGIGS